MQTNYDEIALMHNLSRVIIPTNRYKHIYEKGAYSILLVVALYNDLIDKYAKRT